MFGSPQQHSSEDAGRRSLWKVLTAVVAVLAVLGGFVLRAAWADTGKPDITVPVTASAVTNPDGTHTLTLSGQWVWGDYNDAADCVASRFGTGWNVDWNDVTQPGNVVGTSNGVTIDVGALVGNALNPADNTVYYDAANPCGTSVAGDGIAPPAYGPWGPISHTYPAQTTEVTACEVTYDLHYGTKPDVKPGDLLAGGSTHNGDNSVQKGYASVCATFNFPDLKTHASSGVQLGNAIHDVATLSGASTNPAAGGSIVFKAFAPGDTTFTSPVFTSPPVAVNGNGDYTSPDFIPGVPGTYVWTAEYSGDARNSTASSPPSDPDEAVTVLDIHPAITVVKSGPTLAHEGDLVNYSFLVTNTGDVTLAPVAVDDNVMGHIGDIASLAVGANQTLTKSFTVPIGNSVTNTVTAVGTDPLKQQVSDTDQHTLAIIHPAITVVKSGPAQAHEGDVVTYSFLVTNSGDADLHAVSVDDNVMGHIGDIASLPVGANQTLTKTFTIPAGVSVHNTVTAAGLDPLNKSVSDTDEHTLATIHSQINVVESGQTLAHIGDTITYGFTVTNPGDVPLSNVTVSNLRSNSPPPVYISGDTNNDGILQVGESWLYGTSYTVQPGDPDPLPDTVTATGVDPLGRTVSDTDSHPVDIIHPAITVVKSGPAQARAGDVVTYSFLVTNTGDVTLAPVAVDDDVMGHIGDIASLASGASQTLSKVFTIPLGASVHNTVTAAGVDPLGKTVSDTDEHTLAIIHPFITVVKSGPAQAHEGDAVTYSFLVTNSGDSDLHAISVDDDVMGHIGDIASLPVGASQTLTKGFTVPLGTSVHNTVTAAGLDPVNQPVSDTDDHTLQIIHPAITVVKSGPAQAHEGDSVTYSFLVTNSGDVALAPVSVDDNVMGHIGDIASLAPGASQTLTKAFTVPAGNSVSNTVMASGVDPLAKTVSDTDSHSLQIIHPAITVVKSGPAQARPGDVVTYSFLVTNTGDVALAPVAVDDDVMGHIGDIASLASGASQTLTKAFTIPAGTSPLTNTVTALGTDPLGKQVSDTDSHTLARISPAITVVKSGPAQAHEGDAVTYSFLVTNSGDADLHAVSVDDNVMGHIGDIAALAKGASQTLTKSFTVPAGSSVTNTVTAAGLDPTNQPVSDTDQHTLQIIHPAITVVKSGPAQARPGDSVTYSFAVTNSGDVPLAPVSVDDDVMGHIGDIASLAPGASQTLTKVFAIPAGTGNLTNTVTATGTDPLGKQVSDTDNHTLARIAPAITVVKSGPAQAHEGDVVTYSFLVTNSGDADLHAVSVDDNVIGHIGDIASLAKGASQTLSKDFTVPAGTSVHNTVTAAGLDPTNQPVSDTDDHTLQIIHPAITVVKSGPAHALPGDVVTYSFKVTNSGDVDLHAVSVDDDVMGHIGSIASLAQGASQTLSKDFTIPDGTSDLTNTVTATGLDPLGQPVSDTDTHTLARTPPGITIEKSGVEAAHEGDAVTYSFKVTNTGESTLTDISVDDDVLGHIGDIASLAPGASQTLSKGFTVPVGADDLVNTATACGLDPSEHEVCDTDHHTLIRIHPAINVAKSGPAMAHVGDTVVYTFTVTNPGDVPLADVKVSDDTTDAAPVYASGDANNDGILQTSETWIYTGSHLVTAGDPDPLVNTVTATGTDPLDKSLSDTDTHSLDVAHPAVTIDKTASPASATAGDTVTYSYKVTNTGDVPLTNVAVTDDVLGTIGTIPSLDPGQSATLTKSVTVSAATPTHNVGTATGSDPLGKQVTATDPADITIVLGEQVVRPPLAVTGGNSDRWFPFGAGAALAGLGLIVVRRRLRHRPHS